MEQVKSNNRSLHITALGSSFAAGPGIQPQVYRPAGRSAKNYAHILAERLGAELTDLSVSGATLQNVLSEPQNLYGTNFEPQLNGLPPKVDIVTITGGGNDLKYIGYVMDQTLQSSFLGRMVKYVLSKKTDEESLTAEDVAKRFTNIIDKIRETSPKCRIFLVEYLTLFGPHTRPSIDVVLDEAQINHAKELARTLQTAYRLAAEAREGVKVIPVAEKSREHDIGSEEPWVEGFSMGIIFARKAPYHPNARGMENVAHILYEELKGDNDVI